MDKMHSASSRAAITKATTLSKPFKGNNTFGKPNIKHHNSSPTNSLSDSNSSSLLSRQQRIQAKHGLAETSNLDGLILQNLQTTLLQNLQKAVMTCRARKHEHIETLPLHILLNSFHAERNEVFHRYERLMFARRWEKEWGQLLPNQGSSHSAKQARRREMMKILNITGPSSEETYQHAFKLYKKCSTWQQLISFLPSEFQGYNDIIIFALDGTIASIEAMSRSCCEEVISNLVGQSDAHKYAVVKTFRQANPLFQLVVANRLPGYMIAIEAPGQGKKDVTFETLVSLEGCLRLQ
jgi:hypothetical protein